MGLAEKVTAIISDGAGNADDTPRIAPETYAAAFRASSTAKAMEVLSATDKFGLDQSKIIYISIGSSECYEIEYILENSDIERFVGFDISHAACEQAWGRLATSIPPKQLTLISGDALHNTAELHGYIRELSKSPDDIILISIHGVLHEIIQETVTELQSFVASLCQRYPNVLLYIREPCEPTNLPDRVFLEFGDLTADQLEGLGRLIARKLNLLDDISKVSDRAIRCNRKLASELIVKLFYIDDFEYEIREKITAVDPTSLASLLFAIEPHFTIEQSLMNSASFQRQFYEQVRLYDPENQQPLLPLSFTKLVATKGI